MIRDCAKIHFRLYQTPFLGVHETDERPVVHLERKSWAESGRRSKDWFRIDSGQDGTGKDAPAPDIAGHNEDLSETPKSGNPIFRI
jgi:hypothetical protein